jgi:hypothetical protein
MNINIDDTTEEESEGALSIISNRYLHIITRVSLSFKLAIVSS